MKKGYVRISFPKGVKDTRNGEVYSEVIVKEADAKWFVEAE